MKAKPDLVYVHDTMLVVTLMTIDEPNVLRQLKFPATILGTNVS